MSPADRIEAIRRCRTLTEIDALIWKRRNDTPPPDEPERNAWRQRRAELMTRKT